MYLPSSGTGKRVRGRERVPPTSTLPALANHNPHPPINSAVNPNLMRQFIIAGMVIYAKTLVEAYCYYREFCKED